MAEMDGRGDADLLELYDLGIEAGDVVDGVYGAEERVDGFEAEGVDARVVDAGCVEVSGEAGRRAFGLGGGFCGVLLGDGAEAPPGCRLA